MTTQPQKKDEKILVVKKEKLFTGATVSGFEAIDNFLPYQETIKEHREFLWRSNMETDPAYKQIIPYLVFNHNDTYFMMQRKSSASEQRLKDKFSLGIGGHIRQEDVSDETNIIDWAKREFQEEVNYAGSIDIEPLGVINDESNLVGQVHIGFAFLLKGDSSNISIKSELKQGNLMTLDECEQLYEKMETWSQLVFNYLKNRN